MPATQQCRMCDGLSFEYQRLPGNAADDMIIRVPVLTNSMEQNSLREAKSFSASHKISLSVWNWIKVEHLTFKTDRYGRTVNPGIWNAKHGFRVYRIFNKCMQFHVFCLVFFSWQTEIWLWILYPSHVTVSASPPPPPNKPLENLSCVRFSTFPKPKYCSLLDFSQWRDAWYSGMV